MKRIIVAVVSLCAIAVVVFLAYLKGQRDGASLAELRSANFGLMLYDSFDEQSPAENKEKLGQLVTFHQGWATDGPSLFDSWSYWRGVRVDEAREKNQKRLDEIGDEIPPPKTIEEIQLEIDKQLSEQAGAQNP